MNTFQRMFLLDPEPEKKGGGGSDDASKEAKKDDESKKASDGLKSDLAAERERRRTAETKLAEFEKSKTADEAKKLEEDGKLTEALALSNKSRTDAETERDSAKAELATERRNTSIRDGLVSAGVAAERMGVASAAFAVQLGDSDDIAGEATKFVEANGYLKVGETAKEKAGTKSPGATSVDDTASLKDDLKKAQEECQVNPSRAAFETMSKLRTQVKAAGDSG